MKEKPILFSTPMVQAIMDGRKTMTRRIVKPKRNIESHEILYKCGENDYWIGTYNGHFMGHSSTRMKCPYGQPGDLLWVRETFFDTKKVKEAFAFQHSPDFIYKADENNFIGCHNWKPSIHMPKAAARIWLRVTDIRVERLQYISSGDIIDEGIRVPIHEGKICWEVGQENNAMSFMPQGSFTTHKELVSEHLIYFAHWAELWCKINGRESWDLNPFVWVVSFEVVSKNGKP